MEPGNTGSPCLGPNKLCKHLLKYKNPPATLSEPGSGEGRRARPGPGCRVLWGSRHPHPLLLPEAGGSLGAPGNRLWHQRTPGLGMAGGWAWDSIHRGCFLGTAELGYGGGATCVQGAGEHRGPGEEPGEGGGGPGRSRPWGLSGARILSEVHRGKPPKALCKEVTCCGLRKQNTTPPPAFF